MTFFSKETQLTLVRLSALLVVHLLLFLPVLELFAELNHLPHSQFLGCYFVFTQLLLVLVPKWWLWLPLQLTGFLYAFYRSFSYVEPFGMDWIRLTGASIVSQVSLFFTGEILSLPVTIGLLLFMALLTLSSVLLLKWNQPWLSFLSCVGYLLVLQVFTENQLLEFLVPVLFLGIPLIGITHVSVHSSRRTFFLSLGTLSAAGFLCSRLALWSVERFVTQQEAVQTQTISYQQDLEQRGFYDWIETYSNGYAFRQTGYGENDSQLGGPLQQDFTPVFNAYTEHPYYWRISTKEAYTGAGWKREAEQFTRPVRFPFSDFPAPSVEFVLPEEPVTVPVQLTEKSFSFIPYTYGTEEVAYVEGSSEQLFAFQLPSEQFVLTETEETTPLTAYELEVRDWNITEDMLRQSELSDWVQSHAAAYTHIPETVPQRVKDLAVELTQDAATQYDQVKAVEQYLKNSDDFRYSMQDAAFVPDSWDYVDHFLFESKVGYCDHFSTSMAVLVRSLGIPVRWAKGFSSGELVMDEDGTTYRQITNANAHSWPEVYFEGIGWIPFEPTPSFSQRMTETQEVEAEEPVEALDVSAPFEEPEALLPDEEPGLTDEPIISAAGETDPVEAASPQEEASQREVAARSLDPERHPVSPVIFVGTASLFLLLPMVYFKEKWSIKGVRLAIRHEWLPAETLFIKVTDLFEQKKTKAPDETIRHYFEQWIQSAPEKEAEIHTFIRSYEESLYSPADEKAPLTSEQKVILEEMLDVLEEISQHQRLSAK